MGKYIGEILHNFSSPDLLQQRAAELKTLFTIPDSLKEVAGKEYFAKNNNNFHLRVHIGKQGTLSHHTIFPEIEKIWNTEMGKQLFSAITYQYHCSGTHLTNFFFGNNSPAIVEYFYKEIAKLAQSFAERGIILDPKVQEKITKEHITGILNQFIAQKQLSNTLDNEGRITGDKFELFDSIPVIMQDIFNPLSAEAFLDLRFMLYQKCLGELYQDTDNKEFQTLIHNNDSAGIRQYIRSRYFG